MTINTDCKCGTCHTCGGTGVYVDKHFSETGQVVSNKGPCPECEEREQRNNDN